MFASNPSQSRHPLAQLFHLLFKTMAVIMYLIGNFFWGSFIGVTVICIMLLALDFWTVKNVTGRILVGLRWWNQVSADGTSVCMYCMWWVQVWMYESQTDTSSVSPSDHTVFWVGVYTTPILWLFFGLAALFRLNLKWEVIVVFGLILSSANVYGYLKCAKGKWDFSIIIFRSTETVTELRWHIPGEFPCKIIIIYCNIHVHLSLEHLAGAGCGCGCTLSLLLHFLCSCLCLDLCLWCPWVWLCCSTGACIDTACSRCSLVLVLLLYCTLSLITLVRNLLLTFCDTGAGSPRVAS